MWSVNPDIFGNLGTLPGLGVAVFGAYWGIRLYREIAESLAKRRAAAADEDVVKVEHNETRQAIEDEHRQTRKDFRNGISTHALQEELLLRGLADQARREADTRHREIMDAIGGFSQ